MKNKHPKRKLALRMLTPRELRLGIPPFFCSAWQARKTAKQLRDKKLFLDKSKTISQRMKEALQKKKV